MSLDVFRTMDVIGSALTAERTRVNAIASNVANANTLKGVDGKGPYKRKDVILESVELQAEFGEVLDETAQRQHTEVRVVEVREDQGPGQRIFRPEHPEADAEGYIFAPNVNPIAETANLVDARQSYDANVNVFQTTKQMALKALEIGR